jgi:hypothetical protein
MLGTKIGNHTFRASTITASLKNGGAFQNTAGDPARVFMF